MDDKLVRLSNVIETIENQCSYGNMWGNENLTLIDAYKTIDELSAIPAVDAVEVRHGRWLRTPTSWVYCSVCGEEPPQETNVTSDFCPNCGARMDGEYSLYESLKRGLEEAIAYENGKLECRTETRKDGDMMTNLEIAKEIIREHYVSCGIFNSRNVLGDPMSTIYVGNNLQIDICYYYEYFEVFGLTDAEFEELEKYYETLRAQKDD